MEPARKRATYADLRAADGGDGPMPELVDGEVVYKACRVAHDRVTKRALYADEGVPWLWLASPEDRTLEVFALRDRLWLLVGTRTTGERRLPPFEHLVIDVERLFVPRKGDEGPIAREPEIRHPAYRT